MSSSKPGFMAMG